MDRKQTQRLMDSLGSITGEIVRVLTALEHDDEADGNVDLIKRLWSTRAAIDVVWNVLYRRLHWKGKLARALVPQREKPRAHEAE